jgi:hypothetical protein
VGQKNQLAALYRQFVALAADPKMQTYQQLLNTMIAARREKLADTVLPNLRQAMSNELTSLLPIQMTAAFDPAARQLAAQVFGRVAAVLEALP